LPCISFVLRTVLGPKCSDAGIPPFASRDTFSLAVRSEPVVRGPADLGGGNYWFGLVRLTDARESFPRNS